MSDFISEIKRIPSDELICWFARKSIEMFKSQQHITQVEIPVTRFWRQQTLCTQLTAWDILNIEYLSIINSNDYRNARYKTPPQKIVSLYRDYENKNEIPERLVNPDHTADDTFRVILGMSAEQFQYSNMGWIFERFNRNYHILVVAQSDTHQTLLNIDQIMKNQLGCSVNEYVATLVFVFWLCLQSPLPFAAPPQLYQGKNETLFTEQNVIRFIDYYTCTYPELRNSQIRKQLLYAKPFIKTDRTNSVIVSSMFSVAMLVGNGLYWIARDYYKDSGQTFVNAFGLLFEEYVIELFSRYCDCSEWIRLTEGKDKGADFLFYFGDVQILIEAKSSLIGLEAKQQMPNSKTIDKFIHNTVQQAYQQLNSSLLRDEIKTDVPILKFLLLYDEFSNTAIIQRSIEEIFVKDPTCYIITIRDLEILLYSHHNNDKLFRRALYELTNLDCTDSERKSITALLDGLNLTENFHLQGEMDYFRRLLDGFRKKYENS